MIFRVLAILALLAAAASAQVTIDLPLQGYYRVGQYMPIHVVAQPTVRSVLIEGDGFVPLIIATNTGAMSQNFPLLVLSPPSRTLTVTIDGKTKQTIDLPPLQEIGDEVRLIGSVGTMPDFLPAAHFPGKRLVRVDLQSAAMATEVMEAWELLDGIFVDPLPKELNGAPDVLLRLLASGALVAIRSDTDLNESWPWQRDGNWWLLHHQIVGPTSSIAPIAYAPLANWSADFQPHPIRRQIVGDAVIVAILAIGATLLRPPRKALAAVFGVTLVAMLTMGFWTASIETHREIRGGVSVRTERLMQSDGYDYHTMTRPQFAEWGMGDSGISRPLVPDADAARKINLRMHCSAGQKWFSCSMDLSPDSKIALLQRGIWATSEIGVWDEDSPMRALVSAYPGCRVLGVQPVEDEEERLGDLYLLRNEASTRPTTKP